MSPRPARRPSRMPTAPMSADGARPLELARVGDAVLSRLRERLGVARFRLGPCPATPSVRRRAIVRGTTLASMVVALVLTGCTAGVPDRRPDAARVPRADTAEPPSHRRTATEAPADPRSCPAARRRSNLPFFTAVVAGGVGDARAGRRAAPTSTRWSRRASTRRRMQVTHDQSPRWATRPRASSSRCGGARSASSVRSGRRRGDPVTVVAARARRGRRAWSGTRARSTGDAAVGRRRRRVRRGRPVDWTGYG